MPGPDRPTSTVPVELLDAARRWRALDPDEVTRGRLDDLLHAAGTGDEAALAELRDAFAGRVGLGTAGLRAPMGPGPARMNRVVVRRASAALASILPGGALVVVGHDARHGSALFAADVALVLAGAGCRPVLLPGPVPTPLVAFAVRHLGADAAVAVTASHNPAADNGYKVYLGDGAQIGGADEQRFASALDSVAARHDAGDPDAVPAADPPVAPDETAAEALTSAYVAVVAARVRPGPRRVSAAYTAMHGVGRALTERAVAAAGFPPLAEVVEQCEPDGSFPTVAFPNPEEEGALDRLVARADAVGADVGLAHDPDADRLGVIVPRTGGWARLTGDQIGVLLADHLLEQGEGDDRLVVRTIVSSRLLDAVARAHGATCLATPTGFKHVMAAARARPELRLVLGYEEALGFAVGDEVRDKDGIGAALVLTDLVARLRAEGRTLDDRLDDLARRHGLHLTEGRSHRFEGADGTAARVEAMARLRSAPPERLGGVPVRRVVDHLSGGVGPAVDVVVLELGEGSWVAVRPSGTEPKLKVYAEVVAAVDGRPLDAVKVDAGRELAGLQEEVAATLGITGPNGSLE